MGLSKLLLGLLAAAAILGGGPAAIAQSPPPGAAAPQLTPDEKLVRDTLYSGSFEAIGRAIPQLKAILAQAPATYPLVERRPGVIVVRDEEASPSVNLTLLLGAAARKETTALRREVNLYGVAAFLLASYANEMHRPAEALGYLDHLIALQPDNAMLLTEKTTALEEMKRPADALAAIDRWQAAAPLPSETARARVLRARGYALVELGRLSEAETAYRDSLKFEPGHKGAESELNYIAQLRSGGKAVAGPTVLVNAGQAKSGDFPTVSPPPKP